MSSTSDSRLGDEERASKPFLSVVLAAKDPDVRLLTRCLSSFAALSVTDRIEVVIVLSGRACAIDASAREAFFALRLVETPPAGVYAAYNAGIAAAQGEYLLFFGIDDIALSGMSGVIRRLEAAPDRYHVYAAACYMQSLGLIEPSRHPLALVRHNWCHQGVFYRRCVLTERPFDTQYRMLADYKRNIEIVSDPRLNCGIARDLVAYFSAGGESSIQLDLQFRRDFPQIAGQAFGKPVGWLIRTKQIAWDFLFGPPEKRFRARH